MAQMEYRSIGARLRPPRFVVGYRPGRDWIYNARQVLASISRVWGGNGAVIAPLGESAAMSEALVSVTRAYDPDQIAVHVPILADLAHEDPEIVGRVVEGRARRGEDRDAVWRELRTQHVNIEGLDALAEQASTYFSPFKSPSQACAGFHQAILFGYTVTATRNDTSLPSKMPQVHVRLYWICPGSIRR